MDQQHPSITQWGYNDPDQDSPKFVCKVKEPKLSEMNLQQDHQPSSDVYATGQGSKA